MLQVAPLDKPRGLKEMAYQQLRTLVVQGRLEPDTVYSAAQFADMLGVSRTPVREALLQLVSEGFFTVIKQEGYTLRRFSEKEIRDLFETRRLLETYAAEKVTGTLTDADARQLKATLRGMAALAAEGDVAGFLETDRAFHMAIIARLDNGMLSSLMDTIRGQITLFAAKAVSHKGRSDEILREHGAILTALCGKDPKKAVRATIEHLKTTETYVLGAVEPRGKGR
jgi:DNA-binding GntR family transcriptional regulator